MKKKISLRRQLLMILLTFMVLILGFLYLFQVVLLPNFYAGAKEENLKRVASEVQLALDSNDVQEYIDFLSAQNGVCIRVLRANGQEYIAQSAMGCTINSMGLSEIVRYTVLADNYGGTYFEKTTEDVYRLNPIQDLTQRQTLFFATPQYIDSNLMLVKLAGKDILFLSSRISPVAATVETLKGQMSYIAIIVIAATLLLVIFLYQIIVKPLVLINQSCRELGQGKYEHKLQKASYLEVQQLDETLSQAAVQIQAADQAKRDLIANVSHDLRTPLTMITGYTEMMKELPNENTPENLQVIIDESRRLNMMVNDLLDLSKLQAHQIELKKERFNLTALTQKLCQNMNNLKQAEGFTITFESNEEVMVLADRIRLEQVIQNFLNNAVNYSLDDRRISVRQITENEKVRIEIEDHGVGISKEQQAMIWDRYYKVDKEHVRVKQGSGIGLSIVKAILDEHGFNYGVRSQENKGSCFWFELPVA